MPFVHNSVSHDHILITFMTFWQFNWLCLPSRFRFFSCEMAVTACAACGTCTQFKTKHQSKRQRVIPACGHPYIKWCDFKKTRRHLACDLNGITQLGDSIGIYAMDTLSLALSGSWLYVSIHQSPLLCNAKQITGSCLLTIWLHG